MDDTPIPNSGKTILLADDEQFIVVAYGDGLERAGYQVLTASNGTDALSVLKKNKPDLLVLELMIPKINGLNCFRT
jgi:two-component system alkaline phosphatase synthesis response regulator PhoP